MIFLQATLQENDELPGGLFYHAVTMKRSLELFLHVREKPDILKVFTSI